jgi:uncharacterized protein (TIGR03086 family)
MAGMTDTAAVADRHRRLAEEFGAWVAAVPHDRWENPSPCAGWSARAVVRHLVEVEATFLRLVGADPGDVPDVAEDPLAAWRAASAGMQAELDDPVRAAAEFDSYVGRSTLAEAVDRFVCFDLVIHRWDLARATGLEERLDPAEVARLALVAEEFGVAIRGPGVCGPALTPPPGSDDQTRLLAYLGRQAWPK